MRRPLYGLSLAFNALAGGPACLQVLDSAWASTQTVAPANLQVTASLPGTIQLTWTPIAYVEDGGYYEVSYATAEAGPFTVAGVTADKRAATYTAMNLAPDAAYFLRVRTYTPAHFGQQNALWSDYTPPVTATTGGDTPAPTATLTPTAAASVTVTPIATATPSPTGTPTPTATASPTVTPWPERRLYLPLVIRL